VLHLKSKKRSDTCAFGDLPVGIMRRSHINDYENVYEALMRAGSGTAEQTEPLKSFIDGIDGV
jgi:hypothetical protein